MKDKNKIWNTI